MVSYVCTLLFFNAKCVWEIYCNDTYPVIPFKGSVASPLMISPQFIYFHSVGPRGYFHSGTVLGNSVLSIFVCGPLGTIKGSLG